MKATLLLLWFSVASAQPSDPVAHVLSKLKGVKPQGGGWVALCPAHDDKMRSLSLGVGQDGRVILKCHAGCSAPDVVAKAGLTMAELFAPRQSHTPSAERKQRLVKTYDYVDADGKLLFQTCRFEPKTFRQRRPDGSGGWVWSLGETHPVLYRLPQIIQAIEDGKRIYVVEGEKDADVLTELGYAATTSPMGAGKWRESYADTLKGADVVVFPDNDDVGKSHAEQIAASLVSRGSSVRIVALPGLPAKGDFSDWMEDTSHTLDDLEELIGKTPRWTGDEMVKKHRTRWRLDELWDNDDLMRPPPPIVPRLAWSGRSTLLAAREKSGKSTLISYIAAQVTKGGLFLGDTCERGTVLIVELEEFVGDTARRLRHFGADATRVHVVTHFLGEPQERPQEMLSHVEVVRPSLVVVDSLSAYGRGLIADDNNASQATELMQPLSDLAHRAGVALVIVHHARKTDGRARGSTAIMAGVDIVCEFWPPDEDAEPSLRRMRSAGRVPLAPQYDFTFDGDTYQLAAGSAPLEQRVLEFIRRHPGTSTRNIRDMVTGRYDDISATVTKLVATGMVKDDGDGRANRLTIRQ